MKLETGLALAAALLLGGIGLDRCAPWIGAHHQIKSLKAERDRFERLAETWERAANDWKFSFKESEKARIKDRSSAVTSATNAEQSCARRVEAARKSAFSIAALVNKEPTRDPNGCPVRALLDPGELRDAIDPTAG